eukprot:TRINITY_DN14200_c0_g1_i1.p3 TRINITY_DN14200_c0_g1~~TRINITY_DN14200_c0_g1_i1.p3  ORF type:complete len:106 (+),score=28.01 TRINITY_DN14200_c0_g1_i1:148-465(+)
MCIRDRVSTQSTWGRVHGVDKMVEQHPYFNNFAEEVFQKFDSSSTGFIDQKDSLKMVLSVFSKIGLNKLLNQEMLDSFLTQIEISKEGQLSLEESKNLMKKIAPQ